jgi:hypothetical protein
MPKNEHEYLKYNLKTLSKLIEKPSLKWTKSVSMLFMTDVIQIASRENEKMLHVISHHNNV